MASSEGNAPETPEEVKETQEVQTGDPQVVVIKKKRRAIDYIIDKNYANEYIQSWLALPFIHAIRHDPNFHSFLNHNELKKEMTESYAVLVRVQQIIKRLYARHCNSTTNNISNNTDKINNNTETSTTTDPNTTNPNDSASQTASTTTSSSSSAPNTPLSLEDFTENIVLFDVCSGKGYAATLLAFIFPKLKVSKAKVVFRVNEEFDVEYIFMIDKDTKMNLQHLTELTNVKMVHFDLFKKNQVREWVAKQTLNKTGLFLGTHLCGELSEMFVDIYNSVDSLKGLVLAPCCLSKRKRIFADTAAKLKVDNYEYWTMHLYWMIQHSKKDINADENVFSLKNNYISAVKTP